MLLKSIEERRGVSRTYFLEYNWVLERAMSGHSKWSTIKHQKAANDAKKGKLFSRLSKAISLAAKDGGSGDPEFNPRLRAAIDEARGANMPKENIERAISRGSTEGDNISEITYEGFGPGGVNVIVTVATDNKNRTAQEIKHVFEKAGGSLGGPGSVSYNFEPKGYIFVAGKGNLQGQMLKLIDLGVEDIEEGEGGLEVYVPVASLFETKKKIESLGYIARARLSKKPITKISLDPALEKRVYAFLDELDDHDDVQDVFANID